MFEDQVFNGNLVALYIDDVTPVDTPIAEMTTDNAILVACLTQNVFDGTTSAISTSSKCSGNFASSIAGEQGWTMGGDGNSVNLDPSEEATTASHNKMFKLWRSGLPFWAFQYDEGLGTVRYGVVRMDSTNNTFPNNALSTFTIALTGIGEVGDQDDLNSVS